jgi:5-methylcytosine-specific restriction endonuclease McrA
MKPATPSAFNIRFAASKQFKEKFDRLQDLVDKNQGLSLQDVFEYALDYTLNNKDPKRRKQRRDQKRMKNPARPDDQPLTPENNKNQPEQARANRGGGDERKGDSTNERFIPRKLQDETFARAQYQCEHRGHTGKRCSARANLHIDHKKALAFGGKTEKDNLQCLCASHHRQKTEKELGKMFIAEKILERREAQASPGAVEKSALAM